MGRGGGTGDGGRAGSWLRTYDRVVAMVGEMVGQVEALVAGRAQLEAVNELQHEFWEARDGVLQARLLQAEESRKKWEAAYMDLLPRDDHRKFAELQESDLEDFTTFIDLLTAENSELKIQLKEVRSRVEHKQNTTDHEHAARSLRAELRKLKEAHETLSSKKDKEVAASIAEKDFVLNQLRRKKEDYSKLLKNKNIEVAQATEAAEKLQQNVEDLQVVAQKKDDEIGRLRGEVFATKKKLQEMLSSAKDKDERIHNFCIENDLVQNQLDVMEQDHAALLKDKQIEAAQAMEAAQKLQQNLAELHVEMDARIGRSRADAARRMLLEMHSLVMEKDQEYQKLKRWHPGTSRKRKYASSLSDDDEQNGNDEEAMGNLVQEPLKKKGPKKRELQEEDRKGKLTDNKSIESERATQEASQAQVAVAEAERLNREFESTHDLQRRLEASEARSQKAEEDKATDEVNSGTSQSAHQSSLVGPALLSANPTTVSARMLEARVAMFEASKAAENCMNTRTKYYTALLSDHRQLADQYKALQAEVQSKAGADNQVDELLKRISELQGEKTKLEEQHRDEVSRLKAQLDEQGQAHKAEIDRLSSAVSTHTEEKTRLEGLLASAETHASSMQTELDGHRNTSRACLRDLGKIDNLLSKTFPHSTGNAQAAVIKARGKKTQTTALPEEYDIEDYLVNLVARIKSLKAFGVDMLDAGNRVFQSLWPKEAAPASSRT